MIRTAGLTLLAGATLLSAPGLAAQNCTTANFNNSTCTVTVAVTVGSGGGGMPTVLAMSLSADSTALTAPAVANYGADSSATITDANAVTLTVRGNKGFHITLKANAANWTGPVATKPASDLSWATASGGPYTTMSTTAATIFTTASATNSTPVNLSFRTKYNFIQNAPGAYSLTLTFTLVSP
jgi:hypothetical protein